LLQGATFNFCINFKAVNKNELQKLIKSLSDLGIISDRRNREQINTGFFRFKYPVNNFSMFTAEIIDVVTGNPSLDRYRILRLILNEVIDKNESDFFSLMKIYSTLAWAAFENGNEDHFMLNQKRIYCHFMLQYDANYAEQNKDLIKTLVHIIPDNSNCGMCKILANNRYEVDAFLENIPIPASGCTKSNGICIALDSPISVLL